MLPAASDAMLDRGVYLAPYLVQGFEVLIAVDSRGVARKHVKLRRGVSEPRATAWLRAFLDRVDPVPRLQLVREDPPSKKLDLRGAIDSLTEWRMQRDPKLRARVNRYLADLAATPPARL